MRMLLSVLALAAASSLRADEPIRFNRDIRPILSDYCYFCHGPDSARRKADLRLDTLEGLYEKRESGTTLVKGDPAKSALYQRMVTHDADKLMPPPKSNKKLTDEQKSLVKRWITDGAAWEPHWSFAMPARPKVPEVEAKAWVRNPIDAFVLAKLEQMKLEPAKEADRRTLIRRVALDLTGLPPKVEDVEAFVADAAPDAYEKLIDKMLASKHWGEHRGRYWLDAARYGDTHGLHFDNLREMWPYRDWVISAFNKNMPFDQFTVEQLAGDLLPNPTMEQLIATGFHRCNITTNEGGSIAEEVLVSYARDRVETTTTVWLGLTAGCAQCHNHKFDPITSKEFYSLTAYFRNITQGAMDGNIPDTPPTIVVPPEEDRPRWTELQSRTKELKTTLDSRRKEGQPKFQEWLKAGNAGKLTEPLEGATFDLIARDPKAGPVARIAGKETPLTLPKGIDWKSSVQPEVLGLHFADKQSLSIQGVGDTEADRPFAMSFWLLVPPGDGAHAIASHADAKGRGWKLSLAKGSLNLSLVGDDAKSDAFARNSGAEKLPAGKWMHVAVVYDGSRQATGIQFFVDGKQKSSPTPRSGARITGSLKNASPLTLGGSMGGGGLADIRFFNRPLNAEEVAILKDWNAIRAALAKNVVAPDAKLQGTLSLLYLNRFDAGYRNAATEMANADEELREIRSRSGITHIMQERPNSTPTARVLFRGQYDQPREEVKPAVIGVLNAQPKDAPLNRLGLAKWIVSGDNPLTARVAVNRFWQEVFGAGIVRTTEDFGATGEPPSHPELLDWLAVEFRESGWDVKKLFKVILLSNTYRQTATTTAEKREKDPANRYLSRGPRFRMEAEVIRDYALAASGLLATKIGGPSVKPYQPEGVWEAVGILGASNSRDYRRDKGDGLYRRSMYWFWKRMAPPASLEIMNAPSRESCTVRRERTNTALQALVTMNDVQFVEAARYLAQQTVAKGGETPEAKLQFMANRILIRPLRPDEVGTVKESLDRFLDHYRKNGEEAKKLLAVGDLPAEATMDSPTLAAWTMVANQLFNLDEVLNK